MSSLRSEDKGSYAVIVLSIYIHPTIQQQTCDIPIYRVVWTIRKGVIRYNREDALVSVIYSKH